MLVPTTYIYEFKNNLFFFIMSTHQIDDKALIPIDCLSVNLNTNESEIASTAIEAINEFSIGQSKYMQYETDIINKNICKWVGARGIKSFEKNSRFLTMEKNVETVEYILTPFDNFNKFPYQWAFNKDLVKINNNSDLLDIGKAILLALERSNYHPERKDPKYRESKPKFFLP